MKISGPNGPASTKGSKRSDKKSSADGSFGKILGAASTENAHTASHVAGPGNVAPIGGILAAQEVGDEIPRQQAIEHGKQLLDELEELRHQLLMGRIDAQKAQRLLNQLMPSNARIGDPKLRYVIDDIELRVKVELAKLGL